MTDPSLPLEVRESLIANYLDGFTATVRSATELPDDVEIGGFSLNERMEMSLCETFGSIQGKAIWAWYTQLPESQGELDVRIKEARNLRRRNRRQGIYR